MGVPVPLPIRESTPQGKPVGVRVWESRKSACSAVMVGIEVEPSGDIISRASGQTSALVSLGGKGDESTAAGKANVGSRNTSLCALHREGVDIKTSITQVVVVATVSGKRHWRGLRRVRGKSHARFSGEGTAVMSSPYPSVPSMFNSLEVQVLYPT